MNKWIKCTDKLPKDGKQVLVLTKDLYIAFGNYINEDSEWYVPIFGDEVEISHWFPYPKIPKQKQLTKFNN